MLNELSQVVDSLDQLGTNAASRHPRINPMSKNRDLLVVSLDSDGKPARVEVLPGDKAAKLFRIEHGSSGSSFPGFNIPTPLRSFKASKEELNEVVETLLTLGKNKESSLKDWADAINKLFDLSEPRSFTEKQEKQFQRSCAELAAELDKTLPAGSSEMKNFTTLIQVVLNAKPTLPSFSESLAELLVSPNSNIDRRMMQLSQDVLFGALDWKKRTAEIGSVDYWKEKSDMDSKANQTVSIYLDLASPDGDCRRVAHAEMSSLINEALLKIQPKGGTSTANQSSAICDAFGETGVLQDKFPVGPKVAELGNVKLFSLNTNEVQALLRYHLKGAQSFPISAALVQKMSDAFLHLASEDKLGITCRAIPSAQPGKRDLLVAYLEGAPEDRAPLAEMFGGEINQFSDADFNTIAQPVLEMLDGKVKANPNLNVRLLSVCPIDKAKKQISLDRRLPVEQVIRAANDWKIGSQNVPEVKVWFYDKNSQKSVFRSHIAPCPLELSSVVNRVWSADAKSGFSGSYQRAFSVADAYDIFLADSPFAKQKSQAALGLLISRMSPVLIKLGAAKTTRQWKDLSEAVRWQSVKSIALIGILLHQRGDYKTNYMKEPITQVGRLLALSDSLHLQYCKHMRKGESPSQLIGNALFNTALDQPVFALARLAERLTPYQAWARTFHSEDPEAGVGLVKYFLGEIAACTAAIRVEDLPRRMADADKAKLLLGYLADHPKSETPKQ